MDVILANVHQNQFVKMDLSQCLASKTLVLDGVILALQPMNALPLIVVVVMRSITLKESLSTSVSLCVVTLLVLFSVNGATKLTRMGAQCVPVYLSLRVPMEVNQFNAWSILVVKRTSVEKQTLVSLTIVEVVKLTGLMLKEKKFACVLQSCVRLLANMATSKIRTDVTLANANPSRFVETEKNLLFVGETLVIK